MQTSRPLQELIPQLLTHINVHYQNQVIYNKKLLDIWNGNLLKYVEESMSMELSPRAFQRSKGRIPPINILNQVVAKLSRVYTDPASRDAGDNAIDKELLAYYEKELDVDNQLAMTNELLNLNKYFALEPYLDVNGVPDMRILPADKFLVWSDNKNDPTAMTVFIKFMGSVLKTSAPVVDQYGKIVKGAETVVRDVALYHIYSNDEFMVLDADGDITDYRENPYGRIPFVYCSNSSFELIPTPDSDNLSMAVLIPKLLADLNYATQFQSHSIMYGIDVDTSNLDSNPDAFWSISSVPGEGKTPSIGMIKPEVDTDKVIGLINAEMRMWLESKGLKTGSVGKASVDSATSGVSKLIDEADASAVNRKQVSLFRRYEKELWSLVKTMHDFWASTQQLRDVNKAFSKDFNPYVKFAENKIVIDTKDTLEQLKVEFDLGLTTPELALRKLYPDMKPEELKKRLQEIEEYKKKGKNMPFESLMGQVDTTESEIPEED